MTDKVLVTFNLTPSERAVLRTLADGQQSAYLRRLLSEDAARRGVEWPDELRDTRGKYPRSK